MSCMTILFYMLANHEIRHKAMRVVVRLVIVNGTQECVYGYVSHFITPEGAPIRMSKMVCHFLLNGQRVIHSSNIGMIRAPSHILRSEIP